MCLTIHLWNSDRTSGYQVCLRNIVEISEMDIRQNGRIIRIWTSERFNFGLLCQTCWLWALMSPSSCLLWYLSNTYVNYLCKCTFWAIINKSCFSGLKTFIKWEGTKVVSRIIRTLLESTMSKTFLIWKTRAYFKLITSYIHKFYYPAGYPSNFYNIDTWSCWIRTECGIKVCLNNFLYTGHIYITHFFILYLFHTSGQAVSELGELIFVVNISRILCCNGFCWVWTMGRK